jgi:hypothetical protein
MTIQLTKKQTKSQMQHKGSNRQYPSMPSSELERRIKEAQLKGLLPEGIKK